MATPRWTGGAVKHTQVTTLTVSGTWTAADTGTMTINGNDVVVTVGTDTSTTNIATLLKEAFNGDTQTGTGDHTSLPTFADGGGNAIAEFREITATSSGAVVTLTCDTAGKPFTISVAESTASTGTIGAPSTTTAATGPNHWDNVDNWSTGAVPVDADTVRFDSGSVDCLYNIDQAAVTPAAIIVTSNFTGTIGLPEVNVDDTSWPYTEYRDTYMKMGATADATNIAVTIGGGNGQGSGRIKIDNDDSQATVNVKSTGQTLDTGIPAFVWKSTHASSEFNVTKGDVGIAFFGGEVATVSTLRVGYTNNLDSDSIVNCGSGTTLTTIEQSGGILTTDSAVTTLNLTGGEYIHSSSTVTTINADSGAVRYNSSGTLTTANVGSGATLDFRQDMRARTVTNCNLYENCSYFDPFGTVTHTNGIDFVRTTVTDLTDFVMVPHRTLSVSTI